MSLDTFLTCPDAWGAARGPLHARAEAVGGRGAFPVPAGGHGVELARAPGDGPVRGADPPLLRRTRKFRRWRRAQDFRQVLTRAEDGLRGARSFLRREFLANVAGSHT